MAAKTLHELEIEIEKIKEQLLVIRRDLDMALKINKQEEKPNIDGGENTK